MNTPWHSQPETLLQAIGNRISHFIVSVFEWATSDYETMSFFFAFAYIFYKLYLQIIKSFQGPEQEISDLDVPLQKKKGSNNSFVQRSQMKNHTKKDKGIFKREQYPSNKPLSKTDLYLYGIIVGIDMIFLLIKPHPVQGSVILTTLVLSGLVLSVFWKRGSYAVTILLSANVIWLSSWFLWSYLKIILFVIFSLSCIGIKGQIEKRKNQSDNSAQNSRQIIRAILDKHVSCEKYQNQTLFALFLLFYLCAVLITNVSLVYVSFINLIGTITMLAFFYLKYYSQYSTVIGQEILIVMQLGMIMYCGRMNILAYPKKAPTIIFLLLPLIFFFVFKFILGPYSNQRRMGREQQVGFIFSDLMTFLKLSLFLILIFFVEEGWLLQCFCLSEVLAILTFYIDEEYIFGISCWHTRVLCILPIAFSSYAFVFFSNPSYNSITEDVGLFLS